MEKDLFFCSMTWSKKSSNSEPAQAGPWRPFITWDAQKHINFPVFLLKQSSVKKKKKKALIDKWGEAANVKQDTLNVHILS